MAQVDINALPGLPKDASAKPSAEAESEQTAIRKLFAQAKAAKDPYSQYWNERMAYYKGRQYSGGKKTPVINIIRATIQTILPLLTDAKPGINILPAEPDDFQFAQVLQELTEVWWTKPGVDMAHTLLEPLMDMCIYDAGILKIFWDADANHGRGDVAVKSIKPDNIFINKEATDFDKDCFYVIERQYPATSVLKSQYPEYASIIKSDLGAKESTDRPQSDVSVQAPVDQEQPMNPHRYIEEKDTRETTEMWEIWIDSEELIAYEEKDGDEVVEQGFKKKFLHGKLITFLPNQNLILQSVENPYKHGKKPYVRFVDSVMPHSFWGEGEAESLMGAQKNANMVLTNMLAYMKLMANPIWKLTSDSGIRREDITNDVALVLEVDPTHMADVTRDIPPAMQAGSTELFATMLRNASMESGVSDVTAGRRMIGVQSGAAIDSLQEANHTRIRLKERNMQVSLGKLGDMLVQLFLQYYTEPRVVRLTGSEAWPKYMEFHIENTDAGYVLNKKDINYNEASDSYVPGQLKASKPSNGIFDIKIIAGTSLPFKKAERANLAMRLFQMGVLTKESLLETLEWPSAGKESAEDEEKARMAAEQGAVAPGGAKVPPVEEEVQPNPVG